MKIALTGPIEGHLLDLYHWANTSNETPDWIICAGDFGIWPDPDKIDRGVRKHQGPGDFAKLYIDKYIAPVNTLTISGVHEDHRWLKQRFDSKNTEIISNIHWLANGYKTTIGDINNTIRITGFGKAHSESTYKGNLNQKSYRHYTRQEVEKACSSGPTDILVLYEHPQKPGLRNIIFATHPKLIVYVQQPSHPKKLYSIQNTPVISLKRGDIKVVSYENNKFYDIV